MKARLPVILGTLFTLVVLGLIVTLIVTRQDKPAPYTPPTAPKVAVPAGTKHVQIYLDGWSQAALGERVVTAATEADETESVVSLVRVGEAEIKGLGETTPDVLARLVARLASTDSKVSCNANNCTAGEQSITFSQLAAPGTLPKFGDIYKGHNITTGLWRIDLFVPQGTQSVAITAQDAGITELLLAEGREAGGATPSGSNGYLKDIFPLSYAFGQLFVNSPAWISAEAPEGYVANELGGIYPDLELGAALKEPLFARGLGSVVYDAAGFTPSQLTYMSSPTSGCGVGVLCYPGTLELRTKDFKTYQKAVCLPTGELGLALLQDSVWEFNTPAPIHMLGIWNGKKPEDFKDKGGNSVLPYTGAPPLISGPQAVRQTTVLLFEGDGVNLIELSGTAVHVGADDPALATAPVNEGDILRLLGERFIACDAPAPNEDPGDIGEDPSDRPTDIYY